MENLFLESLENLSYQKSLNYWSNIFYYNSTDIYSISSRVKNTEPIESTIDPIWKKMDSLIKSGLGYYNFFIDGINIGTGKIVSFNWQEGVDVIDRPYSMTFEIYETGNLFNLTGKYYQEINKEIFNSDFKFVNSFQENISVSLNSKNIQETSQSVSFNIDGPLNYSEKINLKNKIFSGFADSRIPFIGIRTIFPDIISGNINSGYITYFNETNDTINNQFSFEKKSFYDNNNKATWEYSHSIQLNQNEAIVSENGIVKSIYFEGLSGYRYLSGARERWKDIQTGIYNRVNQTFLSISGFSGLFPSGYFCNIINNPIEKRIQEDPLVGLIDYSYSYSNNSKYLNSGYVFSNTRTSSIDKDGYFIVTENGEYIGKAESNEKRFENALSGFKSGQGLILPRITGTFLLASHMEKMLCSITGSFKKFQESTTYREYDGTVSYSNVYSNSPSYYPENSKFVKYTNTINNSKPIHIHNKFLIPRSDEYVQSINQSSEGLFSNSINIIGKEENSIEEYLTESYSKVIFPTGNNIEDVFLRNMVYNFDPFTKNFQATFDYYYSEFREANDNLV